MRIGILSMQRVINYGSFLQAYALKEVLKNLGHECYFIDIKPGKKIIYDTTIKKESRIIFYFKRIDRYIIKRIKHRKFIKDRITRFNNDFFPILGIGKVPNYNSDYDTIIIGSDEVFNCTQKSKWGFAKTLLGEGLDSDNIISYAASCGNTTIDKLYQYGITEEVKEAIQNFRAISVRDEHTKNFVKELIQRDAYIHLDPTLIHDFGSVVPETVKEKDYILIYAYDGRINDNKTIRKIKEFAKQNNKQTMSVGLYQSWCDKQILCTPFELLVYFKNADYVITDTFHGTVFSIKYNKKFVTIVRDSNKQKLTDLLERFNLKTRIINHPDEIAKKLSTPISYQYANEEIQRYKKAAEQYFDLYLKT